VEVEPTEEFPLFYLLQSPLEIYRVPHLKTRHHRATYMSQVDLLPQKHSIVVVCPSDNYSDGKGTLVLRADSIPIKETRVADLFIPEYLSDLFAFMQKYGTANTKRDGCPDSGINGWRYNYGCANHSYMPVHPNGSFNPDVHVDGEKIAVDEYGFAIPVEENQLESQQSYQEDPRTWAPCWYTGLREIEKASAEFPHLVPFLCLVMDETQESVDIWDHSRGRPPIFFDPERNRRFSFQLRNWFGGTRSRFETVSIQLKCYHPSQHETFRHLDDLNDSETGYEYTVACCCMVQDPQNNIWSVKVGCRVVVCPHHAASLTELLFSTSSL
jgi:hypothetical protein